jgi:hypothetical protein
LLVNTTPPLPGELRIQTGEPDCVIVAPFETVNPERVVAPPTLRVVPTDTEVGVAKEAQFMDPTF